MGNVKVIPLPTYKAHLTFFHGVAGSDFKIPKSMGLDMFEGNYAGRCMYRFDKNEPLCYRVAIHVKDCNHIGAIVHEIYHAVSYIFSAMGAIADFDNDEPCAYLMQYLTEEILHWLNSEKKCVAGVA